MRAERGDEASETLTSKQNRIASQAFVIIIASLAGATVAFSITSFLISSSIQRLPHPSAPPSHLLMALIYFVALISLLGVVFWTRFRSDISSLPYADFQQRTMVGLSLANISEILGMVWVLLGGAFVFSLPLFAASALVILLVILPTALRRKSALSQHSNFG